MCRELGGERTGPTGRDLPDCIGTPFIGLEIKAYKKFVFLTKDWDQAVDNAAKLGVIPVLLVREGGRGGRRRVQLWEQDYIAMWNRAFRPHMQAVQRGGLVRIDWDNFVRVYRAFLAEVNRQVKE